MNCFHCGDKVVGFFSYSLKGRGVKIEVYCCKDENCYDEAWIKSLEIFPPKDTKGNGVVGGYIKL